MHDRKSGGRFQGDVYMDRVFVYVLLCFESDRVNILAIPTKSDVIQNVCVFDMLTEDAPSRTSNDFTFLGNAELRP